MEFFEELALDTIPVKPRLWKRYIDDTCCIVKKDATERLLDHLNSVRPSIQLTVQVKKDEMLLFLDTLLRRREDGSLDVTVYKKPTHTDCYLGFQSHHPPHVKRSLVRCLYVRQGTSHRQHPGQPAVGRTPSFQGAEIEWLPRCLHSLCSSASST